jgi:hypothetical protein
MKFLPSVAPIAKLLGDISKNIKNRDTPHLAHFHNQAANFNLGSKRLQTVDLYKEDYDGPREKREREREREKRKKKENTHTHELK